MRVDIKGFHIYWTWKTSCVSESRGQRAARAHQSTRRNKRTCSLVPRRLLSGGAVPRVPASPPSLPPSVPRSLRVCSGPAWPASSSPQPAAVPLPCLCPSPACAPSLPVPLPCLCPFPACAPPLPVPLPCLCPSRACAPSLPVPLPCLCPFPACAPSLPLPPLPVPLPCLCPSPVPVPLPGLPLQRSPKAPKRPARTSLKPALRPPTSQPRPGPGLSASFSPGWFQLLEPP